LESVGDGIQSARFQKNGSASMIQPICRFSRAAFGLRDPLPRGGQRPHSVGFPKVSQTRLSLNSEVGL
jgi:hypothetical protein